MKIAIIPNLERDKDLAETKRLVDYLSAGHKVILSDELSGIDNAVYLPYGALFEEADFIVVLGGDGTILKVAKDAAVYDVPIIGINLGNLGFLSQAERGSDKVFEDIFAGKYKIERCMMLSASIIKDGRVIKDGVALNDAVLSGSISSKIINVSAAVNGTDIGSYTADGLIVASSVGSTAYSLSAGGAVLHPELDAMIITPICPHTLRARSMVIPGDACVEIRHILRNKNQAEVSLDGRLFHKLEEGEILKITHSSRKVSLIRLSDRNFFDVLREKLSD